MKFALYVSARIAMIPPAKARAGLLVDAAPVKVAGAAVFALVGGAEGRLEMVVMIGMAVVVGMTVVAAGAVEGLGVEAGGAGATDDDAGGAHVAHVAGGEATGARDEAEGVL
jgi:hypothetical protein